MTRIVEPVPGDEDEEQLQTTLRPRSLAEFVGQDLQRRRLSIAVQAARERTEPLEHLLLSGPPGLGKTTLVNGQASLTTSSLAIGNHRVTASYSGDSTFNPNKSLALIQKVLP